MRGLHGPVIWRVSVVLVLLATFIGPWTYESVSVPSGFPCEGGYIRLFEDQCSRTISGAWIAIWLVGGQIGSSIRLLIQGADGLEWGRTFLVNLRFGLLLLPVLTTLLNVLGVKGRRLRGLHLMLLILATLSALSLGLREFPDIGWLLWGVWSYIGIGGLAIGMEVFLIYWEEAHRPA